MKAWISAFLAAASVGAGPAPPPRRIVSLNVCADPLLLDLADRGQILALSRYARDPVLSPVAARAANAPVNGGSAEEVLALKPDLVLANGARHSVVRDMLKAQHVRVVDLPRHESLKGIEKAITTLAGAVGHPERGRAEIARLEARLRDVGPPPGRGRVAAYWQRRGYLTGTGTLIDDLFTRVGLTNLARRLHKGPLSQLSVEEMAVAKPDVLVLESATARVSDLGTEMLHHPVLDRVVPPSRRIYLPQAWTVCGGPAYADAVDLMARRLREMDAADDRLSTRSPPAPSRPSGTGASPPPSR